MRTDQRRAENIAPLASWTGANAPVRYVGPCPDSRRRRRRWQAILINFSGPHGPDSFRNATIRGHKRPPMSLKTPPDKWVHRLRKQSMAAGLLPETPPWPWRQLPQPELPNRTARGEVRPGTFRPDLTKLRHTRRRASRSALLGRGLLGLVVF